MSQSGERGEAGDGGGTGGAAVAGAGESSPAPPASAQPAAAVAGAEAGAEAGVDPGTERALAEAAALADPEGGLPGLSRAAPLIGVSIVVAIVAAIAVPNLYNSIHRGKQKRAMSDLRSIGTAVESYQVDFGYIPTLAGPAMPTVALAPVLAPTYIKVMPQRDAWGHAYLWLHATPVTAEYSVVSTGKDGRAEVVLPALGATTNFNRDMYFSNGQFAIAPEGTRQ